MIDFQSLADTVGLPIGQVMYVLCLFATLPVAIGARYVTAPIPRQVYLFAFGLGLMYAAYGVHSLRDVILMWIFAYAACLIYRPACGPIVMVGTMAFLIYSHWVNASGTAWIEGKIDHTGTLMCLVQKLSMVAYDYQDGLLPVNEQTKHQRQVRLQTMPSFWDGLVYVLDPLTSLVGPSMEYRKHATWIRGQDQWAASAPLNNGGSTPPWVGAAGASAAQCLLSLGLHVASLTYLPVSTFLEEPFHTEWSVWRRHAFLTGCLFGVRTKYYFVWGLTHTSLIVAGPAYTGEEGAGRWDTGRGVRPLGVELSSSIRDMIASWNICTTIWLRFYVYERLAGQGQKPGPLTLTITQVTSGVWHGLYPGYLMTFGGSAFAVQAGRALHKLVGAAPASLQAPARLLSWAISSLWLNTLVSSFVILDWAPAFRVLQSLRFSAYATIVLVLAAGAAAPKPRRDPSKKAA